MKVTHLDFYVMYQYFVWWAFWRRL